MKLQAKTFTKTFTAIALSSVIATPIFAASSATPSDVSATTAAKSAGIFTTATIVGGVAGGPVGFFLGALSGAYLGEQNKNHERNKTALKEAETSLTSSRNEVAMQQRVIAKMQKQVEQPIEFLVYFPTGEDALSHQDSQRIQSLANYMTDNPSLRVRLDGFADPRGTDDYNNVLSEERARSVVDALVARGIDSRRIEYQAHGASMSMATAGDKDAYALERKVRIEVYSPKLTRKVAAN
ncbi:OmpA family protein [Teredinibacter turnerae]|uniref:OmpA family protein n=1 Tax=Teredinibacter turnerae TaxID=2426 RepID=UPI00041C2142|nr:OmpA family protein [Teredinibacter turnerae]